VQRKKRGRERKREKDGKRPQVGQATTMMWHVVQPLVLLPLALCHPSTHLFHFAKRVLCKFLHTYLWQAVLFFFRPLIHQQMPQIMFFLALISKRNSINNVGERKGGGEEGVVGQ